jgi:dTDP-glucose pyrophosphorylase
VILKKTNSSSFDAMKYERNVIGEDYSLRQALETLNSISSLDSLTLFVVNKESKLVGTLTDGDIRRSLVGNASLDEKVTGSMNRNFRYIKLSGRPTGYIKELKKKGIGLVPIVNDGFVITKIIDLGKKKSLLPMEAVIMAGGQGRRLIPLTNNQPKPLLRIGGKPILEHTLDLLNLHGIEQINISVNYLSHMIKEYFGDGSEKEIKIKYIEEKFPLGTIGSVSLIDDLTQDYFLVMNSDLLTNVDLEDFYNQVINAKSLMGVATIPYNVSLPYGVVETENGFVTDLREKPTYTYFSNAGIYIIHKSLKKEIPLNTFFNATDLIADCLHKKIAVLNYPILSYWLDIGRHEDYAKAQEDIKHLNFG